MTARSQPVVVITGGGGELGRALAKGFAAEGARIVLLDIPPALRRAQALVRPLRAEGLAVRCDLTRETDICRAFQSVRHRWGRVDILINNAGIEGPTRPVDKVSLRDWERTLSVNLTAAFLCTREALPLMQRRGGSIVQIGSVAGRIAYSLRLPYAVSKAALEALTRGLAAELGHCGIRVNLVAPGPIAGARMERVIRRRARATGQSEHAVRQSYLRASSLRTMVAADDVVRTVVFLCSPAAAHITGQTLEVSAGWTTKSL
ncbi:SDR family oxidoreductase [Acidobacteriia bacterium AH_259_A11_L15]|nr:SDR family oxidoreductase [Acidobacteriia bacterium AH_259_A11_L15]